MKKAKLLGALLVSLTILGACGSSESSSSNAETDNTTKEVKKAENTDTSSTVTSTSLSEPTINYLVADTDFGKIADNLSSGVDVEIQSKQDYSVNFSDTSWAGVNLSIDKVSVVKTTDMIDYSDDSYVGFVAVHFNIDNTQQDISIYPTQAKIVTDYGEQVDDGGAFNYDTWDGDLMAGTKEDGWGIYPLEKLESATSIKTLRLNIHASYDTDDYNDDNAYHTYDITLQLQ